MCPKNPREDSIHAISMISVVIVPEKLDLKEANLTEDEKIHVIEVLNEHQNTWLRDRTGRLKNHMYVIMLKSEKPIVIRQRFGHIRLSNSPFSSEITLAPKKDSNCIFQFLQCQPTVSVCMRTWALHK